MEDPIYRSSKTALILLMVYYSNVLEAEGIAVASLCPGYCATGLNGFAGLESPARGAAFVVKVATEGGNDEVTGTWVEERGKLPR